ncbi:MAG: cell division protein ZapD [Panacagrimonas sp.]
MSQGLQAVVFEQPLNERIRTFLRLEFLFGQYEHHRPDPSPLGARSRLHALLDILVVLGRSDLKKDVLKDLQDQHAVLSRLINRPGVDNARLQTVLTEIAVAVKDLQRVTTQLASAALRENEFLMSVLNRSAIPGGTCAFDLPAYHYWLSQPPEHIEHDLDTWFSDLIPFARAILLDLRLLRGSVPMTDAVAPGGTYVHAPPTTCSLLRVFVPTEEAVYPEISAGSHRFTLRFMQLPDINQRSSQAHRDIAFRLQCCSF